MQEKTQFVKAAEAVKQIWRLTGQEKNSQAYAWAQKHRLHTNARNFCFQGVCFSYWIRLALAFQTQQKPTIFWPYPSLNSCKRHAIFCLEVKRFKLFLWILNSKDLQHFIALNTCGLWLNLHPSCCCTEDDILTLWGSCWETGQDIEQSLKVSRKKNAIPFFQVNAKLVYWYVAHTVPSQCIASQYFCWHLELV